MKRMRDTKDNSGEIVGKIVVGLVGAAALLMLILFIVALTMR